MTDVPKLNYTNNQREKEREEVETPFAQKVFESSNRNKLRHSREKVWSSIHTHLKDDLVDLVVVADPVTSV